MIKSYGGGKNDMAKAKRSVDSFLVVKKMAGVDDHNAFATAIAIGVLQVKYF
jgi:hypothetical protein